MRIAFFGTSEFAVPALRAVAKDVVLVVSQPDRPSGRGMQMRPSPVKEAAMELGLQVESPAKCREPEFIQRVAGLDADFLVVAAYGQIMPVALLEAGKQGAINLHGSILPEYRGAAPIQRCILDGRTETGVTLMQMDAGMDTGDMIAASKTDIVPDETYGELHARLAQIGADLLFAWRDRLAAGTYPCTAQDPNRATHAPKIVKTEAELHPGRSAPAEYNRFRAFTPSPGAYILIQGSPTKIEEARFLPQEGKPGTWLTPGVVAFQGGSIELVRVKPAGKKAMSGKEFCNGLRVRPGDLV